MCEGGDEGKDRFPAGCHGKQGELCQRYREGQPGALGLVVNVVVLWNTIYPDAALARLRAEGFEVRDEDVARLSALGFEHINMLGRYAFTLPDVVARVELRPLRDPTLHDNKEGCDGLSAPLLPGVQVLRTRRAAASMSFKHQLAI